MKFKIPKIKNRPILYITKDSVIEEKTKGRVDIVLSPIYYWVKKEKISIKNEKDAMKFASSIFEGQFENISDYRYITTKYNSDEVIFIAYNPKEILAMLKDDFGISENLIGNIYTVQTELAKITQTLSVNRKKMLVSFDGIISEIPKHSYDSSVNYATEYLKKESRTKFKLKYADINQGGTSLFVASLLPLGFILYFGADIVKKNRDLGYVNSEVEKRRDLYKLPSTSFQIKSIKNRYLDIEKKQTKIRESIYWLQTNNFAKYGKISYLSSNKKGFAFKLDLKKGANLNKIKLVLQKKDKNVDFNKDENSLEVSFQNE